MTANIDVHASLLVLALGALRVGGERAGEVTAEKPQRLLAALALTPNRWVSTAELTEALWPEGAPASARGNLKTYVHLLRQLLPAVGEQPRIDSRRGSYRLVVERHELDVTAFEDLVRDARKALSGGESTVAMERAEAALRLWRGEPYESLTGSTVDVERVRLAELRHAAEDCLADGMLAAGRAEDAIGLLRPLTTANPLREATWERLMRALIRAGRPADAMRAYHDLRKVLADELGTEPGPGPRTLYDELLAADRAAGNSPPLEPVTPTVRRRRRRWRYAVAAAVVAVLAVAGGLVWWNRPAGQAGIDDELAQVIQEPIKRRPVNVPPPGKIVFGLDAGVDGAAQNRLFQKAPMGMVTQWIDGHDTMPQLPGWKTGSIPKVYQTGKGIHLILLSGADQAAASSFESSSGTLCGIPYAVSDQFLVDMKAVAQAFAGKATGPPLLVSVFGGADQFGCGDGLHPSAGSQAYFVVLRARFLQVLRIFHHYAPNSHVALDLNAWLNFGNDPGNGFGRETLNFFTEALRQSDFQSIAVTESEDAIGTAGNGPSIQSMLQAVGRYGPVMVSHYRPWKDLGTFDRDTTQLLTAQSLDKLTREGLFAWSFLGDQQLSSTPERFDRVQNAVKQFGAPAS